MSKKKQATHAPTNKRPGICQYCGKPEAFDGPFCSKECQKAYEEGMERDQPRVKLYSIGMIAGALVLAYGGFMNVDEAMGVGAIIIGMTFLFMPFLPLGTVKSMGYRRSRMLGRFAGAVMMFFGIWAGWFY